VVFDDPFGAAAGRTGGSAAANAAMSKRAARAAVAVGVAAVFMETRRPRPRPLRRPNMVPLKALPALLETWWLSTGSLRPDRAPHEPREPGAPRIFCHGLGGYS